MHDTRYICGLGYWFRPRSGSKGSPFRLGWSKVHRNNMSKSRALGVVVTCILLFRISVAGEQEKAPENSSKQSEKAPAEDSSGLIDQSQLVGLPLNGRSYSQLATLQSSVSDTTASSASRGTGGGQLNVAGSRTYSNNFLLDGTNIMNTDNQAPRSAAGVQLGGDSVLQVQVLAANYGPEYGRSSGGVLNSITRSGSPQFHGTLFEYFRNSKLDTRNFFDPGSGPPSFKRNQFGFTVTGPVVKDKTYFMVGFETMRDRLNQTDVSYFPDAAIRRGPVAPRARPYLDLYPIPNDVQLGNGVGQNLTPLFLPTDESFWTFRVDHKISSRDNLFGRYTFDDATSHATQETFLFHTLQKSRQQYLTLVTSHTFSPRSLMALRAGYTRPVDRTHSVGSLIVPQSVFFVPDSPQFGQILIPGISTLGPANFLPSANIMNSFQFAGDVLLQRGRHSIKFGADIHRYRWEVSGEFHRGGTWSFNSLDSFLQAGPAGTSLSVSFPGSANIHSYRETLSGLYFQDRYSMRRNLQLSLGMRYELATRIRDERNHAPSMPDPLRDSFVRAGKYFFKDNPTLLNFAPRVGLTWSPGSASNASISGGFGIYYDEFLGFTGSQKKSSTPYYNIASNPNFDSSQLFPNAIAAAAGFPFLVQISDYLHERSPMVLRYDFSLRRRLPGGWQGQASYVGARGNGLFRRFESNQFPVPILRPDGSPFFPSGAGAVNPRFGPMTMVTTDGQSFYNSLQLSANKNLSRGLSVQASYTYSKSVDDSSAGVANSTSQYGLMRTLDRGLSDFDLRHRLVMNYSYAIPVGRQQRWGKSGLLSQVLGDWHMSGIVSLRSGTPFTPLVNVRYRGYLFSATRPSLASGHSNNPVSGATSGCGTIPSGGKLGRPELYFDPCAFVAPLPGELGNLGRNTILAPRVVSMDISIQRDFLLDAKRRLQFRLEIFNLPNHTNFSGNVGSSLFVFSGETAARGSTTGRMKNTATTSRQIQLALRLSF